MMMMTKKYTAVTLGAFAGVDALFIKQEIGRDAEADDSAFAETVQMNRQSVGGFVGSVSATTFSAVKDELGEYFEHIGLNISADSLSRDGEESTDDDVDPSESNDHDDEPTESDDDDEPTESDDDEGKKEKPLVWTSIIKSSRHVDDKINIQVKPGNLIRCGAGYGKTGTVESDSVITYPNKRWFGSFRCYCPKRVDDIFNKNLLNMCDVEYAEVSAKQSKTYFENNAGVITQVVRAGAKFFHFYKTHEGDKIERAVYSKLGLQAGDIEMLMSELRLERGKMSELKECKNTMREIQYNGDLNSFEDGLKKAFEVAQNRNKIDVTRERKYKKRVLKEATKHYPVEVEFETTEEVKKGKVVNHRRGSHNKTEYEVMIDGGNKYEKYSNMSMT
jgi:hypothetical protein